MAYENILETMQSVARQAGKYLLTQSVNITGHKSRNDLLTQNDLIIEDFIISGIKEKFNDINIVSEEYNPDNEPSGLSVVIDPIDGTCNFAMNIPLFGIQLALFDNSLLCGSVIYFPTEDVMYTAQKGKGAYKNGKRLFVDKTTLPSDGFLIISDYYDSIGIDFDNQFLLVKNLQKHFLKTRHFGAACVDFAMLAESHAAAYITYYHKIWDIAPGLLLATEAGCSVSSVDAEEYSFNRPGLIVAANDEIIKTIKSEAHFLKM